MNIGEDTPTVRVSRGIEQWFPGLLLAVVSISLYLGGLRNPFVYDDANTVVQNPSIRHLGNLRAVFLFDRFRPLVNLSFAFDYAVWGLAPLGFHLTSILLHAVNVALVFLLFARIVRDCRPSAEGAWNVEPGPARLIPLVVAALFAVHPMLSESVVYVTGRSDVLSGTFFLLALVLMRAGLVRGSIGWIALGAVTFVLALASKEVSAMFPFILLAYDRLLLRPSGLQARRRLLRLHLPLIGLVVLLGMARIVIFLAIEHPFSVQSLGFMMSYLKSQFIVVWTYVRLLLLPWRQSVAHNVSGLGAPAVLGALALGAVCIVAYRLRARAPLLSFGVAWFLLLLVPSSSILPLQQPMAEHRVYLASVGFFLIVATIFARLVQALRDRPVWLLVGVSAAGVLALIGLGSLTVSRNAVWADPVALWREATTVAPRWDTYTALGNALRDANDCEAALLAYDLASQADRTRLIPVAASWICLSKLGRTAEAQELVRHIRQVDPKLLRLCQEIRDLAPQTTSIQSCVSQLDSAFGSH